MADENAAAVSDQYTGETIGFSDANENIRLKIAGEFNLANASAAAAVASILGIPFEKTREALEKFTGTWRRFEKVGKFKGADIISDYTHHPDGLTLTLAATADSYKNPLVVFQPHQHNRTKKLFLNFVSAICESQVVDFIIPEIFDVAGRENSVDRDISSRDLVSQIQKCGKKAVYAKDLEDAEKEIRARLGHDAVIIMGAGDVYKIAGKLVSSNNEN